jgi:hypothetical protein
MLAWVDVNTSLTTQKRLSSIGLTLNVFSDLNTFIDYITNNATEPDSVILIISGSFGQELMPMIEAFPQLRAIYIYCTDANKHIYWAQKCNKIGVERVFSEENDLIVRLTVDLKSTTSHVCNSLSPSQEEFTRKILINILLLLTNNFQNCFCSRSCMSYILLQLADVLLRLFTRTKILVPCKFDTFLTNSNLKLY